MSEEMNKETIHGMLREIKTVAMESSLTGGLRKGTRILVDVYNRCLSALSEQDPTISKLFQPLSAEDGAVHVDEIGVAAALLSRYIQPSDRYSDDDMF